jgi:hypothetical protein
MSYVYEDAEKLVGLPTVGNSQCVSLILGYTKAPAASLWKEGKQVKGNSLLKKGTAIATFVNGKYPDNKTGQHAAFYLSQDAAGIWVVDQWLASRTVQKRQLRFRGAKRDGGFVDPSNNGDAFSVIE